MADSAATPQGYFIFDTTSNTGRPYVCSFGQTYGLDTIEDATPFDTTEQAQTWLDKNHPSQQWAQIVPAQDL